MIQSINDLKSNIKDIGWNPFLVGGASGLGTYALTRLLGGNKWLAAALGLGVGTGAGWLQYNHNDRSKTDNWIAGHNVGKRSGEEEYRGYAREIADMLGIRGVNRKSSIELLSDSLSSLRENEVSINNADRLTKDDIHIVKGFLLTEKEQLKKVLDRDKRLNFLNQRGHRLFRVRDGRVLGDDPKTSEAIDNPSYPKERYPEQ